MREKNFVNCIATDIESSLKTKKITQETEQFLIHWLSDGEKNEEDREVFRLLAERNVCPAIGTNLFRGCKSLMDGKVESYSNSAVAAVRFAGNDGFIVIADTSRCYFKTFELSKYLYLLCEEIILGKKENCFSEEFIEIVENYSGEDEVLMITDLSCSVVLKVDSIGNEL